MIHEITGFLRGFPPFDTATEEALEGVEEASEIEFFPAGAFVLRAGEGSSEHAYVLRTGHAELIDGGRVIDVVGPSSSEATLPSPSGFVRDLVIEASGEQATSAREPPAI